MAILGIDIGGTRVKAGLVSGAGEVLRRLSVPTPSSLDAFTIALRRLIADLIADASQPEAIGFGCKGIIDFHTARIEVLPGTLHFLEGSNLADLAGLSIPVYADNDARTALAGEVAWGAGAGCRNVVMFTLGTGAGGGVLAEGQILRGEKGVAGHLGHITVDPDGPVCICGNHGCLETVFSAGAIESEAIGAAYRGCASALTRLYQQDPASLSCQAVFQAAAEGDSVALAIRDRAVKYLGASIAGLIHVFDPEKVILGGLISEAGDALFGPVREHVRWRTRVLLGREVPVVKAQVSDSVVGAAAVARLGCALAAPRA
ncbi:MAG: ROK family protein [Bryobacteraceae bacterium]|nr:ROK family protein [Bryobacterales bacterium]NUN00373.1 ROK family protein [Bryobacteraceae bacterium]